jgi:hypothetical protein
MAPVFYGTQTGNAAFPRDLKRLSIISWRTVTSIASRHEMPITQEWRHFSARLRRPTMVTDHMLYVYTSRHDLSIKNCLTFQGRSMQLPLQLDCAGSGCRQVKHNPWDVRGGKSPKAASPLHLEDHRLVMGKSQRSKLGNVLSDFQG